MTVPGTGVEDRWRRLDRYRRNDTSQNGEDGIIERLLEILPANGNNLMDAFFAVSDRVQKVTANQQVPWLKFDGSGQIFRQQKFLAVAAPSVITPVPMVPAAPAAPVTSLAGRLRAATKESPYVNSLGLLDSLGDTRMLRWGNHLRVSEATDGLRWNTNLTLFNALSARRAVALRGAIRGETGRDVSPVEYQLLLIHRQRIFREWLFLELRGGGGWIREESSETREFVPEAAVVLEMSFGRHPRERDRETP
jgi:hypothetical protein